MRRKRTWFLICILPCVALFQGCGGGGASPDDITRNANQSNIQRLTNLYIRHQLANRGQGPEDESNFIVFIGQLDSNYLDKAGIDPNAINEIFISERDSQPFDIRYGVYGDSRGSNSSIIFERNGIDGKKMVGFTSRKTEEVDDEDRFEKLKAGEQVGDVNAPSNAPGARGR